jgi:hypothetical protein
LLDSSALVRVGAHAEISLEAADAGRLRHVEKGKERAADHAKVYLMQTANHEPPTANCRRLIGRSLAPAQFEVLSGVNEGDILALSSNKPLRANLAVCVASCEPESE